ncbi:MAG: terminase large subunit, partial [Patescibacteria group bacterium]|nr:terminase large subunit [Patescibacteria group bacterium]
VFLQFYSRVQRATFLDFNPSAEFWLNEHILGKENNYIVIRSNYLDNPFIAENEKRFIESKKDNPDWANWYKVYGLGDWGQLEDAILPYDVGQFDNSLPFVFGLDFGVRDPDACVKVAVDKKRNIIYVKEMLYESGNSTDKLYRKLLLTTGAKNLIVADSASPRTIIDLRRLGLNIVPAIKNRKNETIKKIKEFKIIVEDSYNLMRELNGWTWLDKKAEIPMDGNDHLIDAMLYAASYLIEGRKGVAVV